MKNPLRNALPLLVILLFISTLLKAEGTKEVMPNSTNGVALDVASGVSAGAYRGAAAQNRIRFYISNNATENFYFGYRVYNRNATPAETAIYYRIVDASGTQIVAPAQLPTTVGAAGRINTYAEATSGPNIGGLNPTGYTPRLFDPAANGEYYIELYSSSDAGVTDNGTEILLVYFDFTVATTANVKSLGRIYCQAWNFITYDPATFSGDQTKSIQTSLYGYTLDSTVSKVDLNTGFKPFRFTFYLNKTGVANTGVWDNDRRSVTTGASAPALTGGYNVFLNTPDATLFARSAAPASPVLNKVYGCPGGYFIPYKISMPGDVAILLDLNGTTGYQAGTSDRYLFAYDVTVGDQIMRWDGLNGLGTSVPASTNLNVTIFLRRGRTNMPMYDAELNQNGLTIAGVAPLVSNPKIYWDDAGSGMTNVGTTCDGTTANNNTTGTGINNSIVGALSPAHAWDGPGPNLTVPAPTGGGGSTTTFLCDDYGNVRTLNTWFWPVEVSSVNNNIVLPGCDSDGDGISDNTDIDDDNDGITDLLETGGVNPQGDADGDGIPNYLDPAPGAGVPAFTDVNNDGVNDSYDKDKDGVINALDKDSDNDGIADIVEAGGVDTNGDGRIDVATDSDADGLMNAYDASTGGIAIANLDTDGDGVPNYLDLDSDNDGIPDVVEVGGVDANGDGWLDNYSDTDNDGFDDTVDGDVGNDGTAENTANALLVTGTDGNADGRPDTYAAGIANTDGRGLPNAYDLDSDDDSITDVTEAGRTDANYDGKIDGYTDTDSDGFSDNVDGDVGNDGTAENTANALLITGTDVNNDGKADSYAKANADGSGMPNPYDLDSDNDGMPDLIESGGKDTDGDGRIDTTSDADGNGWQNSYDPTQSGINIRLLDANGATTGGAVFDFDGDGIANYLDLDSDNDGIPDVIEQGGTDSNNDGKLDAAADVDNDGFIDTVDPLNNTSGAALGIAIITTGSTLSIQNLPTTYSTGDNLDTKGLINMLDLDADDDGILDTREAGLTDATNDGIADGTLGADGWSDTVDALAAPLSLPNTDAQGQANFLDIDADNDGIPDNIEGQTTNSYIAPGNADADADGIDDAYDNNDALFAGAASNGIIPANIDGADNPDYTDLDSDNDGYGDRIEGWDTNGNNIIGGVEVAYVGTTDTDGDGLLDEYDVNDAVINPTNGTTPISYPNVDKPSTAERDWREGTDRDGDGVLDNIDIDDDNDGITDVVESGGINPLGDADGDGIPNYLDSTPGGAVPAFVDNNSDGINDAFDKDRDGIINAWDLDSDNDGIADIIEAGGYDGDNNGVVDGFLDSNNNGLTNAYDPSTSGTALANSDTDGDGVVNALDLDADNDGIPDLIESGGKDTDGDGRIDTISDADGNGWQNSYDPAQSGINIRTLDANGATAGGAIFDFDGDGIANYLDLDSDNDGVPDIIEQEGVDTDNNGKADASTDADSDGFIDAIDPVNNSTGAALGTAIITTGITLSSQNLPTTYSAGDNFDGQTLINMLDLDADNDGILDARESGLTGDTNTDGVIESSDTGWADANGDGWADAIDALSSLNLLNTDNKGQPDYLDIDADDDGITDNVEGQATASYAAPLGTDADKDGIDDRYDNDTAVFGGNASNGIVPVNTDGADLPDYRDTDSDNDNDPDTIEGNDLNANKKADDVPVSIPTTDTDGDGLLDFFESNINSGPIVTIAGFSAGGSGKSTAQKTPASGTERDWRNSAFSLTAYTVLPVHFITVSGKAQNASVVLNWTVANERGVKTYEVERSTESGGFKKIGEVAYQASAAATNAYRFVDGTTVTGTVFYRIRQVATDGSIMYSPVVSVTITQALLKFFIQPNPVQSNSVILITAKQFQKAILTITDVKGGIVARKEVVLQKGLNTIPATFFGMVATGQFVLSGMIDGMLQNTKFLKQ